MTAVSFVYNLALIGGIGIFSAAADLQTMSPSSLAYEAIVNAYYFNDPSIWSDKFLNTPPAYVKIFIEKKTLEHLESPNLLHRFEALVMTENISMQKTDQAFRKNVLRGASIDVESYKQLLADFEAFPEADRNYPGEYDCLAANLEWRLKILEGRMRLPILQPELFEDGKIEEFAKQCFDLEMNYECELFGIPFALLCMAYRDDIGKLEYYIAEMSRKDGVKRNASACYTLGIYLPIYEVEVDGWRDSFTERLSVETDEKVISFLERALSGELTIKRYNLVENIGVWD